MSVGGSLRTMAVEDLLDWIDRRFSCGSLTVEQGATVRTFHFDSGYVTSAGSNLSDEHLGQMLIRRGIMDEKTMGDAFSVQADTGVLLGKILLMTDALSEAQLHEVLEQKILDGIADAWCFSDGSFQFDPEDTAALSSYEISVNLGQAMEYARARGQEWGRLRASVPPDDAPLWVRAPTLLQAASDPPEKAAAAARLAEHVAAGLTVGQILDREAPTRLDSLRLLAELLERGALALDRRGEPRAPDPVAQESNEVERAARGRAARGDRSGALEMVRAALALDPDNAALQKLHKEIERSVFAELSRDLLTRFRVPKLLKSQEELQTMEMTDTERYLAGRIDGRWDLLSLMRVSPLREVEALITFKRLADRGIISL